MKQFGISMLIGVALLGMVGCYAGPYAQRDAMFGGGAGAASGAILDRGNPLRGAIIGGTLGAVFGGMLGNIADQQAYQAAYSNRVQRSPVNDGSGSYFESRPYRQNDGCTRVHVRLYDRYGNLRQEEWKRVCR